MNTLLILGTKASTVLLEAQVATGDFGFEPLKKIIIALVVGIVIGFFYSLKLKSELVSVYKNDSAADYTKDKSFEVKERKDMFLYSKTERKEKPKQQPPQ